MQWLPGHPRLSGRPSLSAVTAMLCGVISASCGDASAPAPACRGYPEQSRSPYALPYATGDGYAVIQGNCTPRATASHRTDGPFEYAYDFDMSIGTPVLAAREGTVLATEGRYEDGNRVPGQENYVFVVHPDGTIGRYYHLTANGVRVAVGQPVERETLLGLSGDTGNSSLPHLHFDVARCAPVGCATIPVTFRNARPHPSGLVPGEIYLALPWPDSR